MSSWVRYCVAVYIGLLMSGALAHPRWTLDHRTEGRVLPGHHDAAAVQERQDQDPGEPAPGRTHAAHGHADGGLASATLKR